MKKRTFQQTAKFRNLGFLFSILSVTYLCLFQDWIGTILILIVSFYFDSQYKCPFCNKTFDIRIKPEELEYCPRCGEKLLP